MVLEYAEQNAVRESSYRADMAARMQPLCAALGADGAETFVDESRPVIAVKIFRIVGADEVDRLVVPGRSSSQTGPAS